MDNLLKRYQDAMLSLLDLGLAQSVDVSHPEHIAALVQNRMQMDELSVQPSAFKMPEPPSHVLGVSLRDWFAGQVLAGLAANQGSSVREDYAVRYAYQAADEMLKERERKDT